MNHSPAVFISTQVSLYHEWEFGLALAGFIGADRIVLHRWEIKTEACFLLNGSKWMMGMIRPCFGSNKGHLDKLQNEGNVPGRKYSYFFTVKLSSLCYFLLYFFVMVVVFSLNVSCFTFPFLSLSAFRHLFLLTCVPSVNRSCVFYACVSPLTLRSLRCISRAPHFVSLLRVLKSSL